MPGTTKTIKEARILFENRSKQPVLTITLITICVIIALATNLGENRQIIENFLISRYRGDGIWFLPEIRAGQYWRLITPIFIHFGLMHIVFNSIWLWDLGRAIEYTSQPWKLGALVLGLGLGSNLAQYLFAGPNFGGMSGVVYGLLGYVWAQGRFNPYAHLRLNQSVMIMMLVWFGLCWTGLLGPIANMAHTAGLVLGLLWGWLEAVQVRRHRR